ncbi:hypothetical protein ACPEEZ_14540 [Frigoribacterium sp. 2-23]|uniref:hypothetical protein n=1 Tax=Frigoribacterium sp. 2-23 TaxID=3415006 RepID=UPI003C6FBFC0
MSTAPPSLAERPLWRWTVPALALCLVSLLAIAASSGLESVCPAVYPAPASCTTDARGTVALVGGVAIALLTTAVVAVAAAMGPEARVRPLRWLIGALGLVATVAAPAAVVSAGFAAGERVLLIVLCSLVCISLTLRTIRP